MYVGYSKGHELYYDEDKQQWFYTETKQPYNHSDILVCPKCNLSSRNDEPDPCLGMLMGVKYACCGHGDESQAYVMTENNHIIQNK